MKQAALYMQISKFSILSIFSLLVSKYSRDSMAFGNFHNFGFCEEEEAARAHAFCYSK